MERLYKYHGLGNDFLVVDRRSTGRDIDASTARSLCDRRRGLGADGVLALLPSSRAWATMVVHNADGSVAEMCGNGLRCAVKYLVDHSADRPASIKVDTGAGVLQCAVRYHGDEAAEVEVAMGPARLVAPNLPSGALGVPFLAQDLGGGLLGTAVSMGNPHLVLEDTPPERAAELGPGLECSPLFPERTNVAFCRPSGEGLEVSVWERGVGLTLACGTGACAAAAAYVQAGRLPANRWVPVRLPGGTLDIRVEADLSAVTLKGPATFVYEAVVPSLGGP